VQCPLNLAPTAPLVPKYAGSFTGCQHCRSALQVRKGGSSVLACFINIQPPDSGSLMEKQVSFIQPSFKLLHRPPIDIDPASHHSNRQRRDHTASFPHSPYLLRAFDATNVRAWIGFRNNAFISFELRTHKTHNIHLRIQKQ